MKEFFKLILVLTCLGALASCVPVGSPDAKFGPPSSVAVTEEQNVRPYVTRLAYPEDQVVCWVYSNRGISCLHLPE